MQRAGSLTCGVLIALLSSAGGILAGEQAVQVVVGFDGSCPHDPAGVKREGTASFQKLETGKEWSIRDPQPLAAQVPERELLRNDCDRNFQALAVAFEFPWFGRSTEEMRGVGRRCLSALLRAVDPPGNRWK